MSVCCLALRVLNAARRGARLFLLAVAAGAVAPGAAAQQFNTDNYLAMPHGTGTFLLTYGQSYAVLLNSFSLFPSWEFFAGATMYWSENDASSTDSFSTTLYVKKMFYENAEKNGGFAVMGGSGGFPGYLEKGEIVGSFRTYWIAAPLSVPLFKERLLWDIMPGTVVERDLPREKGAAWAFTYSTRFALYGVVPQSAIVGEVFGAEGGAGSAAEYKAGLRWEPSPSVVVALTYGSALDGSKGAGLEAGVMVFTPRFLCFGGCK
jgi:hypothetical protein